MARLSREDRQIALGRLQAGQSQSAIARHFHVSQSTISRLWVRFQATGSVADLPRAGRPRATTAAHDRFIRLRHLRNRFLSASSSVQALPGPHRLSDQTVRNRLHEAGLRARRPHRGAVLTRRHRQNRVQWGNQHLRWTVRNHWRHVWFSDESYFLLQRHDGRRRVYRRVTERYAPNCVDEAPVHGGGGVMVWGAINTAGRSTLVHVQGRITAQRYVEEILRPHALPLLADQDAIFQQDNARPHTARLTTQFLTDHHVQVLPWPSMSPDMNPIEHLWDELDRRVRRREEAPANHRDLLQALQEEWDTIPQQDIRHLIQSMPRRCRAVVAAQGSHTPY
ncbi:hypothetical protein V1264_002010 [Littorina saxatilis]|uniref:Transposase n=1 Tax=Littorina saxatilis TaxID=31220 RepID=A0AAN9C8I3_9CAEN